MAAANYDITIEQGSDFTLGLALKKGHGEPVDLTGVVATAQIRKNIEDTDAIADFTIIFDDNRSTGKLTLFIPASTTEELDFVNGEWDLKFAYENSATKRIMRGRAIFSKAVTRPPVPV